MEAAANGDQKPPERDVIGNAGIADGAEEYGIVRRKLIEAIFRHHAAGFEIRFAAPVEIFPGDGKAELARGGLDGFDSLGNYFLADTIAGERGNLIASVFCVGHSPSFFRL